MSPDPDSTEQDVCIGRILIVDDNSVNRESLRWLLELAGHEVSEAENGRKALDSIADRPPDLVIMDVRMPEMDGFEACRRIKQDANTSSIPVLLLTGLRDRQSRLKGMEAGANDFLSKPPDDEELKLRVRNFLSAKQLFDQVQDQYDRLQHLETLRDNLTHMIVHDLRSPAAAALGYLEIFQDMCTGSNKSPFAACVPKAHACLGRLLDMISSVLDVSRLESQQMSLQLASEDVRDILAKGIELAGGAAKNIEIRQECPSESIEVLVDAEVMRRVITNLVANAVKFTPANGTIWVKACGDDTVVRIEVTDKGPGIADEHQCRIFEKFGQVEPHAGGGIASSGLGLTFCKLAVEAHGGRIGVESRRGEGSTFWVELDRCSNPGA